MLLAEDWHGDARAWARSRLAQIEATIVVVTKSGQLNEAAKWVDFRDKLSYSMKTWS
jgi:hypothetical protein